MRRISRVGVSTTRNISTHTRDTSTLALMVSIISGQNAPRRTVSRIHRLAGTAAGTRDTRRGSCQSTVVQWPSRRSTLAVVRGACGGRAGQVAVAVGCARHNLSSNKASLRPTRVIAIASILKSQVEKQKLKSLNRNGTLNTSNYESKRTLNEE